MFTDQFDAYVCDGDELHCRVDGFDVTARVKHDQDFGSTPWEFSEGHGPVSEWTTRPKLPSERVLDQDRDSYRYYDWQVAIKIAKRDGWDTPPYTWPGETAGERAERAVKADFDMLRAWCRGEWWYVGIVLTASKNGIVLATDSLWRLDANCSGSRTNNSHLVETANDLLPEVIDKAKAAIAGLCRLS